MTVINDLKTTLAGLKSAQAIFETFSLGTDNQKQSSFTKMLLNKLNPL
jgi:hypothetical protein